MVDRENIIYKNISNYNNEHIRVEDIKLTDTGLILEVNSNSEERLNKLKINLIVNGKKYKPNDYVFSENSDEKFTQNC